MDPTDAVHMAVLAIADKPGGVDLALVQIIDEIHQILRRPVTARRRKIAAHFIPP